MKPFGLYIHIPFCDGKCYYCNFFSKKCDNSAMDEYTDKLCASLSDWSCRIDRRLTSVYFGGGTPSLLGHERLIRIMDVVKKSYSIADGAEITLEANPSSSGNLRFERLREAGFHRLSIGLQSANEEELRRLGRRHTVADVGCTVDAARAGGFDNISLDVMLAVPGQTTESLHNTLQYCVSQRVQHISAYILKVEQGTRFYRDRDSLCLFDDEEQARFYEYTVEFLQKAGYEQYEVSNFSLPGLESRHNLLYWRDEEYLGVGPSAHSFLDSRRFCYPDSIEDFYRGVTKDLGAGGDREEYIMLALRLKEGLSFERYRERFGAYPDQRFMQAAEKLCESGLATVSNTSLSLTTRGFLVSNAVIGYLLDSL